MKYNAFYFLIQKSVIMSVDLFFDRHIFCLLPELAGIIFLQKGADNLIVNVNIKFTKSVSLIFTSSGF